MKLTVAWRRSIIDTLSARLTFEEANHRWHASFLVSEGRFSRSFRVKGYVVEPPRQCLCVWAVQARLLEGLLEILLPLPSRVVA